MDVGTEDNYYWYDQLYQVQEHQRGSLIGAAPVFTGIADIQDQENWSYDATGNWSGYDNTSPANSQTRSYNVANELTEITASVGDVNPTFDQVGNMTALPKSPGFSTSQYDLIWDAWNRLVAVKDGDTVVASYSYDGLKRRISITDADGTVRSYYDDKWQILEERPSADETTKSVYIHKNPRSSEWVLITGASSGFGEEFARQYAEKGHPLVLVARRLDRLQTLAEAIRQQHRIEVVVEQVDLSDLAAVIQLHQRLCDRGIAIDILINNAGHGLQAPFLGTQLDAALAMVQLDVASLTAVTHVFAQDMRTRRRGKILLVSSLLAFQGVENFAVYAAAKAYVLRFGEALHRELQRDGITVTTLCPGMSNTGFATAAQQKITPLLKLLMMQPAPVVRAGIRALDAGRRSVVPGLANKVMAIFTWATPRWLHQAVFSQAMNSLVTMGLFAGWLAIVLITGGCSQPTAKDPRLQSPTVEVFKAESAGSSSRTFTGIVEAHVQSDLGFRVGGKILQRSVDVGQRVQKGQVLLRLDPVDLQLSLAAQQANVAAARAKYIQAKADEMRSATLVKSGVVSHRDYDQDRAALDSARAMLEAAEAQARVSSNFNEYAVLFADADGVIVRTLSEPGQVVAAGQTVIQLAHDGPREAVVNLPEGVRPALGATASARLYGQERSYDARLRQLSDAADPASRTFEARYVLEGEAASASLGSTVTVTLTASTTSTNAKSVRVPVGAIYDRGGGPGVWIVNDKAEVKFRPVQIHSIAQEEVVVSHGVDAGETVVALGAHLLHEGQAVTLAKEERKSYAKF
jgi:RND family efflux transporter MFP subunit